MEPKPGSESLNKLSKEDAVLLHKLMNALLFYTNKKLNIIKNVISKEEFFRRDIAETVPLRGKIYSSPDAIAEFVKDNPEQLDDDELRIISSWKNKKNGEFFIAKYTPEYAVFYDSEGKKAYGVAGITDSFEEMFRGHTPIMVKITLLPFKGKITYDGIFMPYPISFGSGMRKSLKLEVDEAIQKYGVLTSFDSAHAEKETSDDDLLRFYMRSEESRERYWKEIGRLRKKSEGLEAIYRQAEGAVFARDIKKRIKSNGVKGFFAILEGTVVASGSTEKELQENVKKIVPANRLSWIYTVKI